jgi:hypothetical protein
MSHEPGNGGSPEWYTPPELFAALGLEFDLDPCAPPLPLADWLPVDRRYTQADDGLILPWHPHERVWLNPPYGQETGRWVGRLADHGNGIALTFVRLDTPWAQSALQRADAACFVLGRVNFIAGPGASLRRFDRRSRAGAPSMLLAFGASCARALTKSGLGTVVTAEPTEVWELATG